MSFEAVLGSRNRIVVPKEIVDKLGLREGDKLVLEIKAVVKIGTLEVRKVT